MGYKMASVTFGIPRATLERNVTCAKENANQKLKMSLGLRQSVFSTSEKEELVTYWKSMKGRLFGLTKKNLEI
jgi:hypothetical protein